MKALITILLLTIGTSPVKGEMILPEETKVPAAAMLTLKRK